MVWNRIGDTSLSEPMLTRFTDAYMRHWGRWVKSIKTKTTYGQSEKPRLSIHIAKTRRIDQWKRRKTKRKIEQTRRKTKEQKTTNGDQLKSASDKSQKCQNEKVKWMRKKSRKLLKSEARKQKAADCWHYINITWARRRLKSSAYRLFVKRLFSANNNNNSNNKNKLHITTSLRGKSTGHRWIPPTKGHSK